MKNKLFSKELLEIFSQIEDTIEKLKEFDENGANFISQPLPILLYLVKIASENPLKNIFDGNKLDGDEQHVDCQELECMETNLITEWPEIHEKFRFGRMAVNIYNASWDTTHEQIAETMEIEDHSDILYFRFKCDFAPKARYTPKFMILRDNASRQIVVCIRGTMSINDTIVDVCCEETPFLEGYAHSGMANCANQVLEKSAPMLRKALTENPDYGVMVVGHSLGGGCAQLMAMKLMLVGERIGCLPPNSSTKVKAYAIGPPPVYRSEEPLPAMFKDNMDILINNNDCVPRLSVATIARLLRSVREVDKLEFTVAEVFQMVFKFNSDEAQGNINKIQESIRYVDQARFRYLEHPGRILYVHLRQSGGRYMAMQPSCAFSRQIYLSDSMITNHLHPFYTTALAHMDRQMNGDDRFDGATSYDDHMLDFVET